MTLANRAQIPKHNRSFSELIMLAALCNVLVSSVLPGQDLSLKQFTGFLSSHPWIHANPAFTITSSWYGSFPFPSFRAWHITTLIKKLYVPRKFLYLYPRHLRTSHDLYTFFSLNLRFYWNSLNSDVMKFSLSQLPILTSKFDGVKLKWLHE